MKPLTSIVLASGFGLFSAIVSPILVQAYQERQKADAVIFSVDQPTNVVATRNVIQAVTTGVPGKVIHPLYFENKGREDIYGSELEVVGRDGNRITDVGDIFSLEEARPPRLLLKDGRVQVHFDVLKKGEVVGFWVANTRAGDVAVRASGRGIRVEQSLSPSTGFSGWAVAAVSSITLLIGAFLGVAFSVYAVRTIRKEDEEEAKRRGLSTRTRARPRS